MKCEIPIPTATDGEIRRILESARIIAVVGLSDRPERDSHRVASYLGEQGYRILPVNPNIREWRGERAYAGLREVPGKVDVVDIFRRPEAVPEIVEDAIAIGAGTVWMQEGVIHNAAAERARRAGLRVVMNRCMLKEHIRLRVSRPGRVADGPPGSTE